MKKPLVLIGTGMTSALFFAGCSSEPINYEGKSYPVETVAEIIEDKIEMENPGIDYEVQIVKEYEDE